MKLGFVVIYVRDVQDTLSFYQDAFGLKVRLEHKENDCLLYGELETEGAILGVASHAMGIDNLNGDYIKLSSSGLPFGQKVVFVTEQVHENWATAIKVGAQPLSAPHRKPWGQIAAYLKAKEGTLIELCSPMEETAA